MYIVEIKNGDYTTEIHGVKTKLTSGKIVKGINTIDSFTFSMSPGNPGFNLINEFSTLVTAYNTNKDRYDFIGRVLYAETTMDESGFITKTVTCESVLGYLCDSWQNYVETDNWTVAGLLHHLISCHNSLVEPYKQFKLGDVGVKDNNDNLYQAIQRENTWDAIKSKLIDKLGGELRVRFETDGIYLDYLEQIGEVKETEIALSVNMKAITREQDPTTFVTRLIPLGCKLGTTEDDTDYRLDIVEVNDSKNYIDDEQAIAVYGIHVGVVVWDDVTDDTTLKNKGKAWLEENNKVQIKYSISALDLSLIGKAYDDFELGNYHPIKNSLISVNDTARIIKQNIDVCEEVKSTMEIGDNFKTLSDIQREQAATMKGLEDLTGELVIKQYNLNQKLESTKTELVESFSSKIQQFADSITLEVSGSLGSNASIILSAGPNKLTGEMNLSQVREAFANDKTAISISAGTLTFNSNTIVINSSYFTLDSTGHITASGATINGSITTIDGSFKTELNDGSLRLFYKNVLGGVIDTKYYGGAYDPGIALRIEEGGKYLAFTHADDSASGWSLDYYLNAGWNDNYDEIHIFQSSARFLDKTYFQWAYFRGMYLYEGTTVYQIDRTTNEVTYNVLHCNDTNNNFGDSSINTFVDGKIVYIENFTTPSDRNVKNSIEVLPDGYETFIDKLEPVRFKYNDGNSGRYHVGYIAQDVEAALTAAGLSTADFAGYVDSCSDKGLSLRYTEFVALLHKKIKRLEDRIAALENN